MFKFSSKPTSNRQPGQTSESQKPLDVVPKLLENIRQRLVERGFEETLNGSRRSNPPVEKLLDGEQEAYLIALRLGSPLKGWQMRIDDARCKRTSVYPKVKL